MAFAPLYIPKSFSNVSSRLIRLYRYESRRGDSTRGVDILLCIMWTGVAEDSREPVVELAKLTEFDFCEFWIDFNAEADAAGPPLANGPDGAGIEWRPCNYEVVCQ